MKKILHISKYYYPFIGGVEQVARDCVQSFKDGYNQKVICFNHREGNNIDFVDDVEITRVNCQCKIASQSIAISYGKQIKQMLKKYKPDIVIFHYPNPFVAHFVEKYLKNKKFKFILYWHLDITKQKFLKLFFNGQNKKLLKYADKIIATSPNYIEGSPWLLPYKNKCVVIPCCVNQERLKYNDTNIENSKKIREEFQNKVICFAFGRHVQYKGLEYLIKASKLLTDNYVILIGGIGPLTEKLKSAAINDKKVIFLGKLSDAELKNYLLACDIFCFPSITKNEAFGIGLAEAMYYKKPAITFNIPGSGVNYVSINNVTGLEVANANVNEYAKAIDKLAECKKMRLEYGENGHNRVVNMFSFYELKNKMIDVVEK